ncbi:hypothetical protein NA56DRAFT_98631 [Hyaloscypha hepaticicola]|uniref:Uncharacterized protein n=1 Tax=Hyaloscypha hepaticicola TaxID=2082293 RepID=A0A2J6Q7R6_9HELO|nr:hypothetical protein NA56DRAFT_98631 [Hyaloscypha hepaticicola]
MNPLNYLHLAHPDGDIDIRGSKIAVYYTFNPDTEQAFSFVFNFQDGRWKKVVEEPILRLREMYRGCNSVDLGRDPIYLQTAILNSVLRWWNNLLNSFNDQLIAYEEALIRQDLTNEDLVQINAETNQSLHCMAAHLHRYGSELHSLSDILEDIKFYNSCFHEKFVERRIREAGALGCITTTLGQVASYLSAIRTFRDELQQKINNVLALLVDNSKSMSDLLLVQNSNAMQAILQATQVEAEASRQIALQSQRLSEEMMKDSVAMKTAILSMPFFSYDPWLQSFHRIWIWFVFTVPTTLMCFQVYRTWSRRESRRKAIATHGLEMQLHSTTAGIV